MTGTPDKVTQGAPRAPYSSPLLLNAEDGFNAEVTLYKWSSGDHECVYEIQRPLLFYTIRIPWWLWIKIIIIIVFVCVVCFFAVIISSYIYIFIYIYIHIYIYNRYRRRCICLYNICWTSTFLFLLLIYLSGWWTYFSSPIYGWSISIFI